MMQLIPVVEFLSNCYLNRIKKEVKYCYKESVLLSCTHKQEEWLIQIMRGKGTT